MHFLLGVLEDLLQRENQVLNLWTNKHTILERCIWYKSVVQTMLLWLQKTGKLFFLIQNYKLVNYKQKYHLNKIIPNDFVNFI